MIVPSKLKEIINQTNRLPARLLQLLCWRALSGKRFWTAFRWPE